jgi:adenylate cyclase
MLVGATAAGLFDIRTTPLDVAVPGVEVHAQAIEQMLLGEHLRRPDFGRGAEILFLVISGLFMAAVVYASGALFSAVLGAATVAAAFSTSWAAYRSFGLLFDPVYPIVALTMLYIVTTGYLYLQTEAERNRVRNAFRRYMAPSLVEELAKHPDMLKLGGELREVTLMFSDVRSFTSISERLDAERLTKFLNRLLTLLCHKF